MCNVYESRLDSVEAGAPEQEIEVTPEMIKAGHDVYCQIFTDVEEGVMSSRTMIIAVFRAMAAIWQSRDL
jgi:hypothetical protein